LRPIQPKEINIKSIKIGFATIKKPEIVCDATGVDGTLGSLAD
jgi:hypothetical protein